MATRQTRILQALSWGCCWATALAPSQAASAGTAARAAQPAPPAVSAADPTRAEVRLVPLRDKPITGLSLASPTAEVSVESVGAESRPVAKILGIYGRTDRSIVCEQDHVQTSIQPDAKSRFTLSVPLKGSTAQLRCWSIDVRGNAEEQGIRIVFGGYDDMVKTISAKRLALSASLGYSLILYNESATSIKLTLQALTAKVSATYLIRPDWLDVGGNLFFTLLPLSVSGSTETVRYLGMNLQLGLSPTRIKDPWKLSFKVGPYFNKMSVSNDAFGYQPAICPALTVILRRRVGVRDAAYTYAKLVPVPVGKATSYSVSNRELGAGFGWAHPLAGGRAFSLSFDFASLQLLSLDSAGAIDSIIDTTSFSLGAGYSF